MEKFRRSGGYVTPRELAKLNSSIKMTTQRIPSTHTNSPASAGCLSAQRLSLEECDYFHDVAAERYWPHASFDAVLVDLVEHLGWS